MIATNPEVRPQRRTQAERSAEMQIKILTATLECIDRLGLQNTSTNEIVKMANISRGALLHHYATRTELLKAAFGRLLDDEVEKLEHFSTHVVSDEHSIARIVEYLWERFRGRLFTVTVDYLSLSRVDLETQQSVTSEATRFNDKLNIVWDKSLSNFNFSASERRGLMNQTLCLIRGMALQRIWRDDDAYFEDMLQNWIRILEGQFGIRDS